MISTRAIKLVEMHVSWKDTFRMAVINVPHKSAHPIWDAKQSVVDTVSKPFRYNWVHTFQRSNPFTLPQDYNFSSIHAILLSFI